MNSDNPADSPTRSGISNWQLGPRRERFCCVLSLLTAILVILVAGCSGTAIVDVRDDTPDEAESDLAAPSNETPSTIATTTTVAPELACSSTMTPEEKVGQLIYVMTSNAEKAAPFSAAGKIGGVGLLGQQDANVASQVAAASAGPRVPVAIAGDEEGGTVQRLSAVIRQMPAQRDLAEGTAAEAAQLWGDYATRMKELGLTMNFGPTLDVGFGEPIKSRSFSTDPGIVSSFGVAVMRAENAAGITPVVKHWPGLGSASVDPHDGFPRIGGRASLEAKDWLPFQAAIDAGVPGIMVTHADIPGVTNGTPASLSASALSILRSDMKFNGAIITDDLAMGAVARFYPQPQASEAAIIAGADVVIINGVENVDAVHAKLVQAVSAGRITTERLDEAVGHALRLKNVTGPCPPATSATATSAVGDSGEPTTTIFERDPSGRTAQVSITSSTTTTTTIASSTATAAD